MRLKDTTVTVTLVLVLVVIHLMLEPRFFYWDDVQHTFAPVFYLIGDELREGRWAGMTLLLWQGGFLVGEGIYQLLNPISLAVFAMLPDIPSIPLGMAFHSTVWLLIAAVGAHFLSVRLGASAAWASMAGFCYAMSPFLLYWLAASWVNGLVAFAALPWALACMASSRLSIAASLGLAFSSFIVGVSGWIHGMIALALFGAARVLLPDKRIPVRVRAAMSLSLAAGAFVASPQLLATIAAVNEGVRPSNLSNLGRGVADLQGILTFFWPAYVQPVRWFSGIRWGPPLYYAAWFLLPAMILAAGHWRAFIRDFRWLLIPASLIALATLGPEQLGATRWPIRFLPAVMAAIIPVAAATISSYGSRPHQGGLRILGSALFLAFLISWQQFPDRELTMAILAVVIALMSGLVLSRGSEHLTSGHHLGLLSGTLFLSVWIAAEYPVNTIFDDYHAPVTATGIAALDVQFPGSAVQIYRRLNPGPHQVATGARDVGPGSPLTPFSEEESKWVPSGNIPLWRRERLVNGYTPVEMLGIKSLTCGQSIFGWTCDGPGATLFSTERRTGATYADLMRIDAVAISTRMTNSLDYFQQKSDWHPETPSKYLTIYRRAAGGSQFPGTVSYLPEGVKAAESQALKDTHEQITLLRPRGFQGGLVAFSRAYYPGYVATVGGKPAAVERLGGVILATAIPAGDGEITVDISHRLPTSTLWRLLVLLGIMSLASSLYLVAGPDRTSRMT